jgi:hypothetical protein
LDGGVRARNFELSSACKKIFSHVSIVFLRSPAGKPAVDDGIVNPTVDEVLVVWVIAAKSVSG